MFIAAAVIVVNVGVTIINNKRMTSACYSSLLLQDAANCLEKILSVREMRE